MSGDRNLLTRAHGDHPWLVLLAFTACYVAAGTLSLQLANLNGSHSSVWPPAGIALAALLVLGTQVWPAVAAGAFLVNAINGGHVPASLFMAAGSAGEALVAAALVARVAGGRAFCEHPLTLLRFATRAVVGGSAVGATVGVASLVAFGLASRADAPGAWVSWWLSDAVGMLLVTPLLVLWATPEQPRPARTVVEGLALAASSVLAPLLVFDSRPGIMPAPFVVGPILVWAAFRFGSRVTATSGVAIAAIALAGTMQGRGPFASSSANVALLLLQVFLGVLMTAMLAVAAEVATRLRAEAELRTLASELERRVVERTEALTLARNRLTEAQQVAHLGSWEWDVRTDALWWSDELYRIHDVLRDQLATHGDFVARVHPDDRERVLARIGQAMRDAAPFTFEHRIVRPGGEVRTICVRGHVETDAQATPVRIMGIGHDITDRKRAEDQRVELVREQIARRDAESANSAKDAFLATLSHELRTPLNAALGWTHILRESGATGMQRRALDAIHRNLRVQSRLVSDILEVSRIAKSGLTIERDRIDLRAVIEAAVDTVREAAESRQSAIQLHCPPDLPPLSGDASRLQQVVWNLLSNAVKFGVDGSTVVITAGHDDESVWITVDDEGPGIRPEFLPHVFEQFRQADSSPTREHGGLGLGLSIAHEIVQAHGGTITASNRDGGGARFAVILPSRLASAAG